MRCWSFVVTPALISPRRELQSADHVSSWSSSIAPPTHDKDGLEDDVVVLHHSLSFIKECINKNKKIDYFVYPGHSHNVYGKDRLHLMTKIIDYIIEKTVK